MKGSRLTRAEVASIVAAVSALALVSTTGVLGRSVAPEATPSDTVPAVTVEVEGVEYAFLGLPGDVPAGTELVFDNTGVEFHELAVGRIADDADDTLEELVAMGLQAFSTGTVEMLESGPLVADPGEGAEGTLTLPREGRYLATCLVPQGFVPSILAELGVTEDMAPADWPPEALAILSNPTHAELGMVQVFTVSS